MTVSSVCRCGQRRICDLRKKWTFDNNTKIIIIAYAGLVHKLNGRLLINQDCDRRIIEAIINGKLGCYHFTKSQVAWVGDKYCFLADVILMMVSIKKEEGIICIQYYSLIQPGWIFMKG